jgi:hypothetical protein
MIGAATFSHWRGHSESHHVSMGTFVPVVWGKDNPRCSPVGRARFHRHEGAQDRDKRPLQERAFARRDDVNLDNHFHSQWDASPDERSRHPTKSKTGQ